MDTQSWTAYFIGNSERFTSPDLTQKSTLPRKVTEPLARSLAVFQLGESGGGTRLMTYVKRVIDTGKLKGYEVAVSLFIAEEQRHSRLLADMVAYLDGHILTKQWTNSVFRWLRNHFGVEFNIQVLLIAELIAEVYFGLLYRRLNDLPLRACCHRLLADEMRHIAFHTEFLKERLDAMPLWWRWLWRLQFAVLHAVTGVIVAWDHRLCLSSIRVSPVEFCRMAWKTGRRFLRRLQKTHKLWGPPAKLFPSAGIAKA